MTKKQADDICRTALPYNIYYMIGENDIIHVANSIMFYCASMIKKSTDYDCDLEFKINLKNKLFNVPEINKEI